MSVVLLLGVARASAQAPVRSSDSVKNKTTAARLVPVKPKAPKSIHSEVSGGVRLNSNGWSVFGDFGRVKDLDPKRRDMFYNTRLLQLEFTEKRHIRQSKTPADGSGSSSSSYVYGKINNFYALKLGLGFRKMLVGKPDPGTVSIHWSNIAGFSAGLLKPYYLDVVSDPTAIKYSDETKSKFLNQDLIRGSAGFTTGLGELKIIPGGHIKSALHFDFSGNRSNVLGVEAGVNAEFYSQDIQIMAAHTPSKYFVDLFVAIQFGKRW